jgi:uncharacterized protein YydD (DUF2326 family)
MKIKRKQLDKYRGFIAQRQELSQTVGLIYFEGQRYINLLGQLENEFNDFKKELQDEYGSLEFDLDTGRIKQSKA